MNTGSFSNDIIESIKQSIAQNIDEEYTEYKAKCLKDLDYKLEVKRNAIIQQILNGIDVSMQSNETYSLEPTIVIKLVKNIREERFK